MAFSFKERRAAFETFASGAPDVVVIGGGVVGTSIAAATAHLGLSVALLERTDIAAGASSQSTGLAHAGLRYLAQGRLSYVFRAAGECHRLQTLAPQWVRPFTFTLPVYAGGAHSFAAIRFGTWLYDRLARWSMLRASRKGLAASRVLSADQVKAQSPGLRAEGLQGGMSYAVDAHLQDARFTLGLAQAAAAAGARILTYTEVESVQGRKEGGALVIARDTVSGQRLEIKTPLVINATGAWIDVLRQRAGLEQPTIDPSRGIHLVTDRIAEVPLIFPTNHPNKVFFVLPAPCDASIVGTTDTPVKGSPDDLARRRKK